HQTIVPFGPVGTLGLVRNDPSTLQVSVADSTPPNTQVLIRVFFYDSTVGYAEDYDYFSFTINPSYLDLNKNNLTVTFSSIGTIGYNDVLVNQEGSGFLWRIPPPSTPPYGRSLLYQGGLMAGTDSDHVVDVIESYDAGYADMDFTPDETVHYVSPPDNPNAAQELASSYSDSLADPSIQIGIRTHCQAYAFTGGGLASNAIVVNYVFRHLNSSDGFIPPASDSTAAGLYLDWDIGPSGLINETRFDTASQTALTYRLQQGYPYQDYPYIGVKLLSPLPPGAALNYHAIMNDGSQGDLNAYTGLTKANKWTSMTELLESTGPGDVSHTFGLKDMPMRSRDSVVMTLVFALAETPALLHQTIDEAAKLWSQPLSVIPVPLKTTQTALEIFPNPFQHALHISWDASGPARVTIYDAVGRIIDSRIVTGSEYDFNPPAVPSGFYTVDVLAGGTHLRRQVVAEE
ncbi:MAG: T9SS type A sorting domain-containing protein, partial [Candidatus Kapaibacterium sp.]